MSEYVGSRSETIQKALEICKKIIATMTIGEIEQLVTCTHPTIKVNKVLFSAIKGPVFSYYYSLEDSVNYLEELLMHQFNDNTESMCEFLYTLYRVVDWDNGKKNTILITGPPNSFKSTFNTVVADAMINSGYSNRVSKHANFGFMDIANTRIVVMDDPNFDVGTHELLLTILAGDKTNVSIKNLGDDIHTQTPVLISCNDRNFLKGARWDVRIIRYNWQPWDKILDKRIYPGALFALWRKHISDFGDK